MAKEKKTNEFKTPQEEIAFLKKQAASLKGKCTQYQERYKLAEAKMIELKAARQQKELALLDKIKEQQSEVAKLKADIAVLRASIKAHNDAPWWKRVFQDI